MKRTMLGNPFIRPWEHLCAIAEDFAMQDFVLGSWYVCWGRKPAPEQIADFAAPEQLLAAE